MTPHTLFDADPLTASWLLALASLFVALVVIPMLRAALAGLIYAMAAVTGRADLCATAARVMPRVAHLIGGLVIGTAAVAAPAMAAVDSKATLASIDLDRDAGASRVSTTSAPDPSHTMVKPAAKPLETPHAQTHTQSSAKTAEAVTPQATSSTGVYIVRSGDTLWDIAAAHLDEPTSAEITDAWKSIWRANRAVIGDDAGLILPGQQLDLGTIA